MSGFSSRLGMALLAAQGANNIARVNDALLLLDAAAMARVKNRTNATPPAASAGDAYVVADSPSGAWTGKAGQVAVWTGTAWLYIAPSQGMTVFCTDESCELVRGSTKWLARSTAPVAALRKNAASSSITTDAGVSWDVESITTAGSRVFEFDAGNPTRLRVLEDGDYEVLAVATFNAAGTASWNSCRLKLQTSTDGSSWSDVADAAAFGPARPTDVPDCTVALSRVVNLVGATSGANSFLRVAAARASGSSTVTVTANTRLTVTKLR